MKIRFGKLLVVTTLLMMAFAVSAQAQWTLINSNNDFEGKEISREERHTNGSLRTMTRAYFPGTRIRKLEVVITRFKDGSRNRIEERRDQQNRVTFLINEFKNNRGVKIRGVQQWWSYRNASDRYGEQKNFQYNPRTDGWVSF